MKIPYFISSYDRNFHRKSFKLFHDLSCSHDIEMKKVKDVQAAAEKLRREKWIDEKTKRIKVCYKNSYMMLFLLTSISDDRYSHKPKQNQNI